MKDKKSNDLHGDKTLGSDRDIIAKANKLLDKQIEVLKQDIELMKQAIKRENELNQEETSRVKLTPSLRCTIPTLVVTPRTVLNQYAALSPLSTTDELSAVEERA